MLIAERGQKTINRNTSFFKTISNTFEFNDDMNTEINNTDDCNEDE